MRKAIAVLVLLAFIGGCCSVPVKIKEAIQGNEKTISEDNITWKHLLNQDSKIWETLLPIHSQTCEKCKTTKEMRQHMLLREQAHLLRAMKLKEWAEK
jgi:hypothetical protein